MSELRRFSMLVPVLMIACLGDGASETARAGLVEEARWQEPPWYGERRVFATARDSGGDTSTVGWEGAWWAIEERAAALRAECDAAGALFHRNAERPEEVPGEGYALTLDCVPSPAPGTFDPEPQVPGAVAETSWWRSPPWYKDLRLWASEDASGWEGAWLALEALSRGYAAQCASAGGRFAQRPGPTPYLWTRGYAGYFFWIDCFPASPQSIAPSEGDAGCDCDYTWGCDQCWCEPEDECAREE